MATIDFEQIKKLPPDQRVKVLQELENQIQKLISERKKEIEEAQSLLSRAKDELRLIEEIEAPVQKNISVEELFGKESKNEKKDGLENIATSAIPDPQVIRENFVQRPIADIYKRVNDITKDIRESGVITQYQENFLRAANYEVQDREKAIENHQYRASEKAEHMLSAAEKIIRNYLN